jgi:hypothetical protein
LRSPRYWPVAASIFNWLIAYADCPPSAGKSGAAKE